MLCLAFMLYKLSYVGWFGVFRFFGQNDFVGKNASKVTEIDMGQIDRSEETNLSMQQKAWMTAVYV